MVAILSGYGPIIVAMITLVGGIVTYSFQRRADRKQQLIEIRRAAYRAYLKALIDQIDIATKNTLNELHRTEFDLFAVASDNVIKKLAEFSNYMSETSNDKNKRDAVRHKKLLANALLAMRSDCFEESNLSSEEALRLLPMT